MTNDTMTNDTMTNDTINIIAKSLNGDRIQVEVPEELANIASNLRPTAQLARRDSDVAVRDDAAIMANALREAAIIPRRDAMKDAAEALRNKEHEKYRAIMRMVLATKR